MTPRPELQAELETGKALAWAKACLDPNLRAMIVAVGAETVHTIWTVGYHDGAGWALSAVEKRLDNGRMSG